LTNCSRLRLLCIPIHPAHMKRLFPSTLLAIVVFVVPFLPAAETKSAPPAAAGKVADNSALAGEYVGSRKARDESTEALRLKLKQEGGAWVAEVWFSFEGIEYATKLKSIEVAGSKLEMVITWEVQGVAAQSKLSGEWTGEVLAGKYESTTHEGAAHGTWKVTRS